MEQNGKYKEIKDFHKKATWAWNEAKKINPNIIIPVIMNEIKKIEAKINEYKDDLFGTTLFYEETKLMQPPSFLKKVNFEEHYKNIIRRGETIISEAETILNEVKINHDVDELKESKVSTIGKRYDANTF